MTCTSTDCTTRVRSTDGPTLCAKHRRERWSGKDAQCSGCEACDPAIAAATEAALDDWFAQMGLEDTPQMAAIRAQNEADSRARAKRRADLRLAVTALRAAER